MTQSFEMIAMDTAGVKKQVCEIENDCNLGPIKLERIGYPDRNAKKTM